MSAVYSPAYSPAVAFGLYATMTALKAKLGQLDRSDGRDLLQRHSQLVPGDCASAFAAADFVAALSIDAAQAGDDLLEFLAGWPPERPTPSRMTETTLVAAAGQFAAGGWQDRKDCGHG